MAFVTIFVETDVITLGPVATVECLDATGRLFVTQARLRLVSSGSFLHCLPDLNQTLLNRTHDPEGNTGSKHPARQQ